MATVSVLNQPNVYSEFESETTTISINLTPYIIWGIVLISIVIIALLLRKSNRKLP